MLKFVRLDLGSRSHGLRPILLPTFFYAGQIRKVVDTGSVSTAQVMVLNELRMLCVWMGCQIGLLSGKHAHVLTSTPFIAGIVNVKHALHRKKFYNAGIKMVELLESMCQVWASVGWDESHGLPPFLFLLRTSLPSCCLPPSLLPTTFLASYHLPPFLACSHCVRSRRCCLLSDVQKFSQQPFTALLCRFSHSRTPLHPA